MAGEALQALALIVDEDAEKSMFGSAHSRIKFAWVDKALAPAGLKTGPERQTSPYVRQQTDPEIETL
jgi:hypothetical protein